jgi:hypothetical protein
MDQRVLFFLPGRQRNLATSVLLRLPEHACVLAVSSSSFSPISPSVSSSFVDPVADHPFSLYERCHGRAPGVLDALLLVMYRDPAFYFEYQTTAWWFVPLLSCKSTMRSISKRSIKSTPFNCVLFRSRVQFRQLNQPLHQVI